MKKSFANWRQEHSLAQNIIAGLTVSFVALSLGAAFGVLSGRGAFAGMISAALIALITSLFGGTRVQCSGPTGPMTTVTAILVATAHDLTTKQFPNVLPDHFINITLFLTAGILLVMAIFRLGKYITFVPNVVVSGFMNGIAIIIWLDQIKKLFGLGGKAAYTGATSTNLIVTLATLIMVFVLPKFFKKYMSKYASLLSATFITIIVMTTISYLLNLQIEHVQLSTSIHSWSDVTNIVHSQFPTTWSWKIILAALPFALQLAILAYLDTLLTSLVVDKMTKEKTKQNKELMSHGLATATVSLLGGIPGAQATIRSVLIVKEKATSRIAGILVGVFALIEILLFQDLINVIPQAVFAGILFKVGYDVLDILPIKIYLKELFKKSSKLLHNFFSSHSEENIFVTHREMLMIIGATLMTVLWDLNFAVGTFTVIFYLHNKVFMKKNPMRDLKPITETESFIDES